MCLPNSSKVSTDQPILNVSTDQPTTLNVSSNTDRKRKADFTPPPRSPSLRSLPQSDFENGTGSATHYPQLKRIKLEPDLIHSPLTSPSTVLSTPSDSTISSPTSRLPQFSSRAPPTALAHPQNPSLLSIRRPTVIPVDDLIRPPARGISAAVVEEEQGAVIFKPVYNDGLPLSTILLTGLKNIFQKQLPKMPRDYVGKVVYDTSHVSMCLYKPGSFEVIGGICYKPFFNRHFAEIVFCAISSTEQVKGYGARLMNHLKDFVRSTGDLRHFLTCADNYAIGYFRKQGFTVEITLDKAIWMGYIKDYEGATVMQCTIVPKIKYLDVHHTLAAQKREIYHAIFKHTRNNIVYPGLDLFKRNGGQPIDPMSIPGVVQSGWTPELSKERAKPPKSHRYLLFTQLLDDLRNHKESWPFLEPVDPQHARDYYEIIKEPMDLKTLESLIESDYYKSIDDFKYDVQKIFVNCRLYNEPHTKFVKAGNALELYFNERLSELCERMTPMYVGSPVDG